MENQKSICYCGGKLTINSLGGKSCRECGNTFFAAEEKPEKKCETHPECSHNTNDRDMNKPCSIEFPISAPVEEWENILRAKFLEKESPEFTSNELIDFIRSLLSAQREQKFSGVSAWWNYGNKFGYSDFFLQKEREEMVEQIKKLQIMVGNLVYNNDNEMLDIGITQILNELRDYKSKIKSNE